MAAVSAQFDLESGMQPGTDRGREVDGQEDSKVTAEMLDSGHSNWFPFEI